MKRLLLLAALVAVLAVPCHATVTPTLVTYSVRNPDGTIPATVATAYAKVTSTTSGDPAVVGSIWVGTYFAASGTITVSGSPVAVAAGTVAWVLPQSSQVLFQIPVTSVNGTYTLGSASTYNLNTLIPVTPSTAPGWAGPLAPLLTVPSKGGLIGSTGAAWSTLAAGANNSLLTADSAQTAGVKWAAPSWLPMAGGSTAVMTGEFKVANFATASLPTPGSGEGWLAWDSTTHTFKVWNGSAWAEPGTAGDVNAATDATLTRSGAGPYTLGLNLGNANTWTAAQSITSAANTLLTLDARGAALNWSNVVALPPLGGDSRNKAYNIVQSAQEFAVGEELNQILSIGYNMTHGGQRISSGDGGIGWVLEGHYEPVAGTEYGEAYVEFYDKPTGAAYRPLMIRAEYNAPSAAGGLLQDYRATQYQWAKTDSTVISRLTPTAYDLLLGPSNTKGFEFIHDGTYGYILPYGGGTQNLGLTSWNYVGLPSLGLYGTLASFSSDVYIANAKQFIFTAAGGGYTLGLKQSADGVLKVTNGSTGDGALISGKFRTTVEGGQAVKLVAGEALNAGEVVYVKISFGADGKVWKNPADGDMPVGVVYASASADADVWVVVSGLASVLPTSSVTAARGNIIYSSATEAGRVDQAATLPAVAPHNREVGHYLDTGSGNGAAARAIVHFN